MKNVSNPLRALSAWLGRGLLLLLLVTTTQCQEKFDYKPDPKPNGQLGVDALTFLRSRSDFSLLTQAIDRAGVASTISGAGPITLFAPDDIAFRTYLGTRTVADIPVATLRDVLLYHVVAQNLLSPNISLDRTSYPTLLATKSVIAFKGTDNVVTVNNNRVFTSNLEPTNGVIHVVPRVLTP